MPFLRENLANKLKEIIDNSPIEEYYNTKTDFVLAKMKMLEITE